MSQETKFCSRCNIEKPLGDFWKNQKSRSPDGAYSICKACIEPREYSKDYYQKNREKKLVYQDKYRKRKAAEIPNWKKLKEMAYKTGKTFDEVEAWFNKQWMKQQAQCAICGKVFCDDDCIDHDHDTNELRGLLCWSCNIGIGALKDSPEVCLKASEYLTLFKE